MSVDNVGWCWLCRPTLRLVCLSLKLNFRAFARVHIHAMQHVITVDQQVR